MESFSYKIEIDEDETTSNAFEQSRFTDKIHTAA